MLYDISQTTMQLLWKISWQAALLSIVVLVISRLSRKAPASFRYMLWMIVLCKFFVPPIAQFPAALAFWLKAPTPDLASEYGPYFGVVVGAATHSSGDIAQTSLSALPFGWSAIIAPLWLIGALTMLALAVVRNVRLHRLLRKALDPGSEIATQWIDCARSVGLRKLPAIRLSNQIFTPMLVGLVRPTVYLPIRILEHCSKSELRAMLLHELAHVKRRDMVGVWLSQMAQILFFFHPMMWYACRAIRSERELACDQLALATSAISPKEYAAGYIAALKLMTSSSRPVPSLAMAEPFGLEKRRLEQILRNPFPKFSLSLAIALVVALAAGLPSYSGCESSGFCAVAADPDQAFASDIEPILRYAGGGNLAQLKAEVESNPDVLHARDDAGSTPLHWAAQYGHKSVVQFLIDSGAGVNATATDGSTPLARAAFYGFYDVAALLISKGAWVNAKDRAGFTPLIFAAGRGNKAVAELLLDKGAYVNARDTLDPGTSPLFEAARQGHESIVGLLISRGAKVDIRNKWHRTPLMTASYRGQLGAVKTLIAAGADVNAKDKWEHTPLSDAVLMERPEVARYLISKGADVNARSADVTPLFLAAHHGRTSMVTILLDGKAEIDARSNGFTPLFEAVAYNHLDIVNLLLKAGADVNAGANGQTPTRLAQENGNEEIVKALRAYGGIE